MDIAKATEIEEAADVIRGISLNHARTILDTITKGSSGRTNADNEARLQHSTAEIAQAPSIDDVPLLTVLVWNHGGDLAALARDELLDRAIEEALSFTPQRSVDEGEPLPAYYDPLDDDSNAAVYHAVLAIVRRQLLRS